MNKTLSNISYRIAALICLLAVALSSQAREWLIKSGAQLSSNATSALEPEPFSNLIDGDSTTYWHSDYNDATYTSTVTEPHYLQVDLGTPLTLNDDEDIVIYTRRRSGVAHAHPTTLRIEGSNDGTSWAPVAHAYFVYRGPRTEEYSSRIHPSASYRYFRFTVTANNSRTTYRTADGRDIRFMNLAEFNILRLGSTENYSDKLIDRFRLTTDYYDLGNLKFEHTHGIADARNRYNDYQTALNLNGLFDADGNWTKDKEFWDEAAKKNLKLAKPDMTYLDSSTEADIRPGSGVRQRANEMEHILYAVPGDAIALYPYYDFNTTDNYKEQYVHWYDYYTGGSNPYLDFLINPENVVRTTDNGFFGGTSFGSVQFQNATTDGMSHPGWFAISSVADWKTFADRVNKGETSLNAYLLIDINNNKEVLPSVGTPEHPYRGHFNGFGHSFGDALFGNDDYGGIFGYVAPGAVIEDFWMYTTVIISGGYAAGVVGVIDSSENGTVTIRRVVGDHEVKVTGKNAGGILGSNWSSTCVVNIENCGFFGKISGGVENGAITGWIGHHPSNTITNCYDSTTDEKFADGIEGDKVFMRGPASTIITNCYSKRGGNGLPTYTDNADLAANLGSPWYVGEWSNVYCNTQPIRTERNTAKNALIATFMVPRDVYAAEGLQQTLQFPDGRDEIVIACDVSQEFNALHSFIAGTRTLVEPTIGVRHIFRIRDGKKFADDNMSTFEKNRKYINENIRYVNAPSGRNFQIRFDSPVPKEGTTRSRWYYKAQADGSDYRRICSMAVDVYDKDGKYLCTDSIFYADSDFKGYGTRTIDGVDYHACGGGGSYNRMLVCNDKEAVAGKTYIVRLVAKDINGKRIIIPDGSGAELWVQEFRITFLGPENASVVSEAELMSTPAYENRRPDNLRYLGELRDAIDYDDYTLLESTDNVTDPSNYFVTPGEQTLGRRYKFAQDRQEVDYTFGYHAWSDYDYSNYNVMNHSNANGYHMANGADGLYDRKYYDTKGREHGYFFFINACTDPGVMGRLKMGGFCTGSTVHVSGWYCEGSGGEVANLAFNFVAVLNNGQRVPIHTFVSGYVPEVGTWHNIYYSFIPEISHLDKDIYDAIDHFELELDNNCRNSGGADYAIDDIRVYITTPDVEAKQTKPLCNDSEEASLKVSSPYSMLLQSLGIHEAASEAECQALDIYYTFIDKEKYDIARASGQENSEAFDNSVLRFPYRDSKEDKTFGHLNFYNWYEKHRPYDAASSGDVLDNEAFRELVGTEQWITFNTHPGGQRLRPGKEFYVVLYTPLGEEAKPTEENASSLFDPTANCAKVSTFRIQTSGQIKIDGKVIPPGAPIEVCEGQSPVVQLDLATASPDENSNDQGPVIKNAYFDWYTGSFDEFMKESYIDKGGETVTLRQMLVMLRSQYPDSTRLDLCEPKGELTQEALDYMTKLTHIDGDHDEIAPKLRLHASSYVFPPVEMPEGQDVAYVHVVAVPFDYIDDSWLVCTAPTEVTIAVRHHAPTMSHGFAEGIEYPGGITDVPLRIGLRQLKNVSATAGWSDTPAGRLKMPVRDIVPATMNVSEMVRGADPLIYLAATDDPQYSDLGIDEAGLMPVGEIVGMIADSKGVMTANAIEMVFYDSFKFKEGYTYTMRYNFEELAAATKPDDIDNDEVACKGQDSFTLMVVPEYMKWTGAGDSTNWADDTNWHRASSADLHYNAGEYADHDLSENISDGVNSRIPGFAPLDFSNVIIDKNRIAPELFVAGDKNISIGTETFIWSSQPDNGIHKATDGIQYHMAARSHDGSPAVDCRPWLANECSQIHFADRGEILGQQHLRYKRAHIEIELDPSRWYTLASPLAGIVAGDMYLPTASARQETELYMPVTFDRNLHDRFAPAVFQRSWNKAYAWVHEVPDGSETDPKTDVFVETTWSGVYNEVNEKYDAGTGFSIKVDGSSIGMAPGEKALLRLPKDDLAYDYYSDNDADVGTHTVVRTAPAGRLNDTDGYIELSNYHAGNRYFMVGNPFMSHIDMVKFLEENSNVIYPKYWILTENAQLAAVMDPISGALVSNASEAQYIAPMQGFFVEALTPIGEGESLKLKYTSQMSAVRYSERGPIKSPGSRSAGNDRFTVSLVEDDSVMSQAVIAISDLWDKGYKDSEDAAVIFDPSLGDVAEVYTIAGNMATSINLTSDAAGTEIGLRTSYGGRHHTLRFEGVDALDGLCLYDKNDGSLTPLSEGLEIKVEGEARGRFYLLSDLPTLHDDALTIRLEGRTATVTSAYTGSFITANVYDTLGRSIGSYSINDAILTFDLDPGMYIIEASDGNSTLSRKFVVK